MGLWMTDAEKETVWSVDQLAEQPTGTVFKRLSGGGVYMIGESAANPLNRLVILLTVGAGYVVRLGDLEESIEFKPVPQGTKFQVAE